MVGSKVVIFCVFKAKTCLLAWMHIILRKFRNLTVVDVLLHGKTIWAVWMLMIIIGHC